jgi:general secretion pathway protein C
MLYFPVPASTADRHLGDSIIVSERDPSGTFEGKGSASREAISLEKISLAAPDLDLRLVGTVVADDPRKSVAIVDNRSSGKQELYHEGDRVGQVLIKKILRNKVIVDPGGGDVVLTMEFEESPDTSPAPREPTRSEQPQTSASTARLDREEAQSAVAGPSQFMQQVRIRPHFQEGQLGGFLIYRLDPDSVFAEMGLQNGDVITAVNGEPIATAQRASDVYHALEESGEVVLEVKRGEETKEIRVEIQ